MTWRRRRTAGSKSRTLKQTSWLTCSGIHTEILTLIKHLSVDAVARAFSLVPFFCQSNLIVPHSTVPRVPQCMSPPQNLDSPPLSRKWVCTHPPPPSRRRGAFSPAGGGLGESQIGRLEKKLSTLSTLWIAPFPHPLGRYFNSFVNRTTYEWHYLFIKRSIIVIPRFRRRFSNRIPSRGLMKTRVDCAGLSTLGRQWALRRWQRTCSPPPTNTPSTGSR